MRFVTLYIYMHLNIGSILLPLPLCTVQPRMTSDMPQPFVPTIIRCGMVLFFFIRLCRSVPKLFDLCSGKYVLLLLYSCMRTKNMRNSEQIELAGSTAGGTGGKLVSIPALCCTGNCHKHQLLLSEV